MIVGRQRVVKLPQTFRRYRIVSNLEKLNADGPRICIIRIERLGGRDDGGLRIVGCLSVRDDDDIERLDVNLSPFELLLGCFGYSSEMRI